VSDEHFAAKAAHIRPGTNPFMHDAHALIIAQAKNSSACWFSTLYLFHFTITLLNFFFF
jgi:hypothetical protein